MAVFKKDLRRITISADRMFIESLDKHLKNFALTDRSRWFVEAGRERCSKKPVLHIAKSRD